VTETPADQANPGSTVLNGADPARVGRWATWREDSVRREGRA
jgi:hypothetical protein